VGLKMAESTISCLLPSGRRALERARLPELPRLSDAEVCHPRARGTRARKRAWTTRQMIAVRRCSACVIVVFSMSSEERIMAGSRTRTPD